MKRLFKLFLQGRNILDLFDISYGFILQKIMSQINMGQGGGEEKIAKCKQFSSNYEFHL